jgi:hypothetical protein
MAPLRERFDALLSEYGIDATTEDSLLAAFIKIELQVFDNAKIVRSERDKSVAIVPEPQQEFKT